MMELSHSLTLNEEVLAQIAEPKRPVFVYEWLRFLDMVLVAAQTSDIKGCQKKLVEQLIDRISDSPGPPTRKLIGRCLATLFTVGDTFLLFDAINRFNEIVKNKDDSPSYLATKLGAITCIGAMYERLGRMMGRSFEETVQILIKCLRNAESQTRCEIMTTMEKICVGMEGAMGGRDVYKAVRQCLTDRTMAVRSAAAKCLLQMLKHTSFLHTTELENLTSLCFRAFEGSNYDVRCTVGRLLGVVVAATQQTTKKTGKIRTVALDEAMGIMMTGFLRGGVGFLKGGAGEMIKGTSVASREIRVGVTHAYVTFVQTLGSVWLERYQTTLIVHVLDLVSNPKAATTHVDAVHSRKCVSFILRSILRSLSEKAQVAACKDLCQIILRLVNNGDGVLEPGASSDQLYSQHGLVCALQELGYVVQTLGTTASSLVSDPGIGCNVVDTACAVLLYAAPAARLSAAWCLRSVCIAIPSQLTPLIDRCTEKLESLKAAPEAVAGHSVALAALVGSTRHCPLGIPHARGKVLFNIAEDLLRSASQNTRMSLPRTQAGWLIIGSIMTLGPPVVRGLLPRMLLLWRISFPRSSKELESEKARGDAFTWTLTLEGRSGALTAIHAFLEYCSELVTPDVVRRLLAPIDSALAMLSGIAGVIKSYGQHLKASAAMLRLRLYEALSKLPASASSFESSYGQLLRLLVAEFTLTENPANTTTSLLRAVCHADDSVILGSWLQETDHKSIEDQMEPNRRLDKDNLQPNSSSGSGALEHDPSTLYKRLQPGELIPGPLPLGVAVIDMSVSLFGLIFPRVAQKHRLQMLEHFAECIRQNKSVRQEAIQINVFAAVLSGMKGLADAKTNFGQDDVRKAAVALVLGALTHSNQILRCASAECLGRMSQVIGDSRFIAEVIQNSFDKLKSARDVASRTGHSLALGCVHHHVGGMGSGQHLGTSVSILLALAQDASSPVVQAWSLHSLALIADSGGPLFRAYVEPTAALSLRLLLHAGLTSTGNVDVVQCVGKLLQTIITTIGPELHGNTNSMCTARSSFLCACAIMQEHHDALVQAEATTCLQQLHMFAPRHVNLSSLVPTLCKTLGSSHLLLRRAAVACLRQLSQREAREVCEHALTLAAGDSTSLLRASRSSPSGSKDKAGLNVISKETGLPGVLFGMLDTENDQRLVSDIHDTVTSMLQALAEDNLAQWLGLCKDVLTSSLDGGANASPVSASAGSAAAAAAQKEQDGLDGESFLDGDSDEATFSASSSEPSTIVDPRWPTRVFAAESVCRIIAACRSHKAHFDLALARELQSSSKKGDYLVLHLSDLVRMAFMAATSDSDPLRLAGLHTLQLIIDNFSRVPEPEFPGHVILEQYQAQVGAALRPAFSPDTSSHVTAVACQVCSAWIGSEVARDLNDLRRVHQLLVSSLAKLDASGTGTAALYNESTATLEKLAILKAWAEVYVVAMRQNETQLTSTRRNCSSSPQDEMNDSVLSSASIISGVCGRESLLDLVSPELPSLSQNWLSALRDHAILSLTTESANQQRRENGAFYSVDTADSARIHYRNSWTPILHAATLFLTNDKRKDSTGEEYELVARSSSPSSSSSATQPPVRDDAIDSDRFHLIFGICMEALCTPRSTEPLQCVLTCLRSLHTLLTADWARAKLVAEESRLSVELCNVLHRLLLTRESPAAQLAVMDVVRQVVAVAHEAFAARKKRKLKELAPANQEPKNPDETALLGEGGASGSIVPGKSVVFAVLEVCLCGLVRHLPALNPSEKLSKSGQDVVPGVFPSTTAARSRHGQQELTEDGCSLVRAAVSVMTDAVALCSPLGSVAVLPTVLHLTTGVLKEVLVMVKVATATDNAWSQAEAGTSSELLASTLHSLKQIVSSPYASDPRCVAEWLSMLQSSLVNILDLSNTNLVGGQHKVYEVGVILAVGMFIISAPSHVFAASDLHNICLNLFRRAFESDDFQVRLTAVHTLEAVFEHPDRSVSVPYIHALAGRIVDQLNTVEAKSPQSDGQLTLTLECVNAIDVIVSLAEPQNRVHILTLAIPIYVKLLSDPSTSSASISTRTKAVHDAALQRLMKIGPLYPQDFCTVMARAPQLRIKLEAAVRENQIAKERTRRLSDQSLSMASNHDGGGGGENTDANATDGQASRSRVARNNGPSIKLKTDFSNFTG